MNAEFKTGINNRYIRPRLPSLLAIGLALGGLAACGDEKTPQDGSINPSIQQRFNQLDRDGDGRLSAEELNRPALFQTADRNRDGYITLQEANDFIQQRRAARREGSSAPGSASRDIYQADRASVPANSRPVTLDNAQGDSGAFRRPGRLARGEGGLAPTANSLQTMTLMHQGRERSYLLYVPSSYQPGQGAPLMLVFHGGGGRAAGIANTTGMNQLAEQHAFIVAYPNGTGARSERKLTWNDGSNPPPGYAELQNIDDVGFIRQLLQHIKARYSINSRRVYAVGLSKGGMFAYRLACELSDQFAAIAAVAGVMTYSGCAPRQPVAILHIHGTADENVPLQGGQGRYSARSASYPPVMTGLERWQRFNQCAPTRRQNTIGADATGYSYLNCADGSEVTYYLVQGGGHAWPGAAPKRWQEQRGVRVSTLPASELIWKFFAAHTKPPAPARP